MKKLSHKSRLSASLVFIVFTVTANLSLAASAVTISNGHSQPAAESGGSEGGGLGNNGFRPPNRYEPMYRTFFDNIFAIRDNLVQSLTNSIVPNSSDFRSYCVKNQSNMLRQQPYNQLEVLSLCSELNFSDVVANLQKIGFESTEISRYKTLHGITEQKSIIVVQESFLKKFEPGQLSAKQIFLIKKELLAQAMQLSLQRFNQSAQASSVEGAAVLTLWYLGYQH